METEGSIEPIDTLFLSVVKAHLVILSLELTQMCCEVTSLVRWDIDRMYPRHRFEYSQHLSE